MYLLISKNGIGYCGKIHQLRELLKTWPRSTTTVKDFIKLSLH